MSNISVTTIQNVIDVTQTSGITVTTPTGQTINVEVPNTTVDVTTTTDEITVTEVGVTNTDQLIEGTTNLFFTNARARSAISLTTDDSSILSYSSSTGVFTWDTPTTTKINEGTNLYYTSTRANNDFDTRFATKTTTNLAEGTNLYYTTARANTDFDTRLATKSTTNLSEGTNLYYTTARANTDFDTRLATKTTDNLTEGSTNKYFSQALARQSLSAGTGISYDSNTGVITNTSINTDTTYTINASSTTGGANLNLVGSDSTTDTVKFANGTNVTVTRTDADTITIASTDTNTTYTQNFSSTTGGANLNLVGSDSTTDTVKFANGTGVTVAYTDANTATVSIGQSVATTDAVTFGSVNIDSLALLDSATLTTSATTADQVLDTFTASAYRTAKYVISITSGTDYQSVEMLVVHNGTTASQTTYADVMTNTNLATFNVDIDSGSVRLLTTPVNAVTAYKVTRTAIVV